MHDLPLGPIIAAAHDLPLVSLIAAAFAAAWALGLLTQKLGLSPIVGYLLGGIVIGPNTPGFVGDMALAPQLAEIGVILLMFGVGLHFHLKDLLAVKNIAIPGALVQIAAATGLALLVAKAFDWPFSHGLVLGMAVAVASTVVLIRLLMDNNKLQTTQGHVAVGWLLVEDLFTVIVLVMLPVIAGSLASTGGTEGAGGASIWISLGITFLKLGAMTALYAFLGAKVIPWVMVRVAKLRSRELFTLTVLVMAIALTTAAYHVFGASMALGAFLAGMVVGQSPVSHQAAADALPMRDAFSVLFFVSVGMLFEPAFLIEQPWLVLSVFLIVVVGKPLAALIIVVVLGHSLRTALTVAIALAQIGEFSFILGDQARVLGLLSQEGSNVLVACAILSITTVPLMFKLIDPIEKWAKTKPTLWKLLNRRGDKIQTDLGDITKVSTDDGTRLAVVVGYGPAGQTVERLLHEGGLETVVIDMNMDTVLNIRKNGGHAIYGDAANHAILEQAGVAEAEYFVVTLPHSTNRVPLIEAAREMNPNLRILTRAHYLKERPELEHAGADWIGVEEEEAAVSLAEAVMRETGLTEEEAQRRVTAIRIQLQAKASGVSI